MNQTVPLLSFYHFNANDGRRIRWQPGWPTYQVIGYGARNKVAA